MRYLSENKIEELKNKLADLKARRIEISGRLREVLEYGDIRENSEYDEANEAKEEVEAMIAETKKTLAEARVVRVWGYEEVVIGSRVVFEIGGMEKEFLIADPLEAMPDEGVISIESPIGREALGRRKGDEFLVETPKGEVVYKIKDIFSGQ